MTDFEPLTTFRASAVDSDPERSDRIREEFRARIATMATDEEGRRPFDPPPDRERHTRRQAALALVATVAVLAAAAAGAFRLRDDAAPMPSLDEVAAAAASRPDQALVPGQYLYRTERASGSGTPPTLESQWTARDGSGQRVVTALQIGGPDPDPPSLTVYPAPGSLQFARLSYDELRTLPTVPDALVARLRELGASDGRSTTDDARALADVLALALTPPDVAAAAVEALTGLGGTAVGPVEDPAGRTGLGVRGADPDAGVWMVVLDPRSGLALGFEPTWTAGGGGGPSRAWLDQQITDRLPG